MHSPDPVVEKELARQLEILRFGTSEITPDEEFVSMLRKSITTGIPLRVKCGIDPTGADVHLGHLVPYRKMRQFQDLGHVGVVIIGDYTASIGDPTGKNESRPALDSETIKQNARSYMDQVYTVVNPDKTEVCFQSEWFEDVGLKDVIAWAGQTTVAKLLSHDTFSKRLEEGLSLSLHELFYPVLQGVDSVYVKADVELGGSDQKFNVLMGRDYQRAAGQRPQVAMLLPIITGTCGTQKMSKSLGNYIAIKDEPFDKFGKIMSIPDVLMLEYYKYLTDISVRDYEALKTGLENGTLHPNEAKKKLAGRIVSFFHGEAVGDEMRTKFENVFKKGEVPDDAPEFALTQSEGLVNILTLAGVVESKNEARRLIKQGAVGIVDGEKLMSEEAVIDSSFAGKVLKIGKRKFLRLK
jgi:tyrosyl-tRNA synthetase